MDIKATGEAYRRRVRVTIIGKHSDETTKVLTAKEARRLAKDLLVAADKSEEDDPLYD